MNHTELGDAFEMADVNKNGWLSRYEYSKFYEYFIAPFQSCLNGEDDPTSWSNYSLDIFGINCILSSAYLARL